MNKVTFLPLSGAVCAFFLSAAPVFADVVTQDDMVVVGSLCVGFDCVADLDFGFTTLMLRENNNRISFIDTSATSSFATTDWELTANGTLNGDPNYFAINDLDAATTPFLVEGSAPSSALYIDSSGSVGFGTSAPAVAMHVVGGNSPALRIEQDTTSGFSAQAWDIVGNETGFLLRDVTNGSSIPMRVETGTGNNALYIDSDSNIGLGLSNPSFPLHVKRSAGALQDMVKLENDGDVTMIFSNIASGAATPEWKVASFDGNFFIGTPTTRGAEFLLSNTGNLTISGNFISGATTLSVPDYVFEDDYDLLSLTEVRDFIDANGHLPRIPSAGEINAGGINISEMQMSLLEKIEELTLYALEQQAEIAALRAEISTPEQH